MNIKEIKSKLEKRNPKPEGYYEFFGVMVPIIEINGSLHILLEIRSSKLKSQPGEISFPGGKMEEGETPDIAAIREIREELMIPESSIKILKALDYLVTPFNFIIYPFTAQINDIDIKDLKENPDEIEDIIIVPLKFFLENEPKEFIVNVGITSFGAFPFELIPGGENYYWKTGMYPIYFYEYKGMIIWGITARIIKNLIDVIKRALS
ncbi:NUDIX hydrolase [Thermovenabulum sp.]|uniref:NUDIX hydrolase n=1 Tax=Thermovenabulum sp. TaxID=3100335 RepID=UPI003C7ADFC9